MVGEDADSELVEPAAPVELAVWAAPLLGAQSTESAEVELPLPHRLSNLSTRVAFAFSLETCVD